MATDEVFEVQKLYFGVYSFSGMAVRVGFGYNCLAYSNSKIMMKRAQDM